MKNSYGEAVVVSLLREAFHVLNFCGFNCARARAHVAHVQL